VKVGGEIQTHSAHPLSLPLPPLLPLSVRAPPGELAVELRKSRNGEHVHDEAPATLDERERVRDEQHVHRERRRRDL
jgi:hypothetical protein